MAAATTDGGAKYLAMAYQLGSIALILGDLSTIYFRIPFRLAVFVFTTFAFTLYVAASGAADFHTQATAPFLVVLFSLCRFLEAHLLTSSYRSIAVEVDVQYRETAARTVSLCDLIIQTMGAALSTAVVASTAHC